jgi:superoxide reductase
MKIMDDYRCSVCGNLVTVLNVGGGTLTCCNKPMILLEANTTDAAQEKHVPVIEKIDGGFRIKVGSAAHPMEEDHYIQWIGIHAGGVSQIKFLKPGDAPEAEFKADGDGAKAAAYCNKHGLWKAES